MNFVITYKKILRLFALTGCRILCFPVFVVVLLTGLGRRVRIGYFTADRVGHFIFDVFWYKDRIEDRRYYFDVFFLKGPVSNKAFEQIVWRKVRVWNFAEHVFFWLEKCESTARRHILYPAREVRHSRDPGGELRTERCRENLFEKNEKLRARAFLEKYSIKVTDKFVCFVIRDAAYLEHVTGREASHWDYHSYRNSSVRDFERGAKALADRGYFVFRVGRHAQELMAPGLDRVIDLAGDEELDDLIDIWLLSHCAFVVTTGTGIDTMALCTGRPMVFVNALPLMHVWSWHHTMTFPKPLTWTASGSELSFEEYVQNSMQRTDDYTDAGIKIGSLSPEQIKDAVVEFDDRLNGRWSETPSETRLQSVAWKKIIANSDSVLSHSFIHPKARFASEFLQSVKAHRSGVSS